MFQNLTFRVHCSLLVVLIVDGPKLLLLLHIAVVVVVVSDVVAVAAVDDGADGTVWLTHTAVAGQCFQKELESFGWLQQLREIFVQI